MIDLLFWLVLFLFPVEGHTFPGWQRLPSDYQPKELITLNKRSSFLTSTQKVDSRISKQVEQLIADAGAGGMCLVVSSGYRSYKEQVAVYATDPSIAMKPGRSEHQTGLAVDFQGCPMRRQLGGMVRDDLIERPELAVSFQLLPEYRWLVMNADKYGIQQTYSNEAWHWKFNIKK